MKTTSFLHPNKLSFCLLIVGMQKKHLAVVVPAFREHRLILKTLEGIPDFIHTIVVVDDASKDGTAQTASSLQDPRVHVVEHQTNRGVFAAIATGYQHARHLGADVIAVMAGDNQMHPDDLRAVMGPIERGEAEYVKGNRLLHPQCGDMPLARRLGTHVLGKLTGYAIGLPQLGDSQCGYTAIDGTLVDRLPLHLVYPRYGYPNDLLGWIALLGGRITEVPVRPVYAEEQSGLRPWHALVALGLIARVRVRMRAQGTAI
jgi:glycosyltransferase involved in cell wall biosynthesis